MDAWKKDFFLLRSYSDLICFFNVILEQCGVECQPAENTPLLGCKDCKGVSACGERGRAAPVWLYQSFGMWIPCDLLLDQQPPTTCCLPGTLTHQPEPGKSSYRECAKLKLGVKGHDGKVAGASGCFTARLLKQAVYVVWGGRRA